MPVVSSQKILELSRTSNPKLGLIKALGDLSNESVMGDLVLIAIYIRPEKTTGGIYRPIDNIKEDEFQGKVGLIVKSGPQATEYEDATEPTCKIGDWVVFTIKDGVQLTVNGVACRLIPYSRLRMKISNPDLVF